MVGLTFFAHGHRCPQNALIRNCNVEVVRLSLAEALRCFLTGNGSGLYYIYTQRHLYWLSDSRKLWTGLLNREEFLAHLNVCRQILFFILFYYLCFFLPIYVFLGELTNDLVDACIPGDVLSMTGIVKVINTEGGDRGINLSVCFFHHLPRRPKNQELIFVVCTRQLCGKLQTGNECARVLLLTGVLRVTLKTTYL